MNEAEFRSLFPNASPALLRRNCPTRPPAAAVERPGPDAQLERAPGTRTLAAREAQKGHPGRLFVRFVSVRKLLLDPDNLSEKWLLDCLRYCGAVRGDEPDKVDVLTTQRKALKGEEEHTEIEIYELNEP